MTKEETKARFQSWCQREIGNHCSKEDYAMFNNIMALLEQQSDDCVSRQAVLEEIEQIQNAGGFIGYNTYSEAFDRVDNMPSVTLTHGTCKDCKRYNKNEMFCTWHGGYLMQKCDPNFYCADFEKRGNENG